MTDREDHDSVDNEVYTQREWDRVVGYETVPDEHKRKINSQEEKQRRYDRG